MVGLGVSFAFGNTINPGCPDEVKQAIQNWTSGLDERSALNQPVARTRNPKAGRRETSEGLRALFLSSLITLTFNTPIHSQILVSTVIQKLFAAAKHHLGLPASRFPLPALLAVFTALKRFFEKVVFLLLGLILPASCLTFFSLSNSPAVSLSHRLYYRFNNLRL